MSHIQTEQAQNNTSMGWTHMQPTSNNKPHSFSERAGIGSLGLSLRPNRRPKGVAHDEPRQMQSPTVPTNLFMGDSPPPTAGPMPSLEQTLSTLAATLEGPKRGSYTLNRAFMRAWEENNPPVPQLPKVAGGSFPTRTKAPVDLPISFPRPDDEPKVSQSSTAVMEAPPSQPLPPPPPAAAAAAAAAPVADTAGERTVARKHSIRQQATLYPKRNYSLPAALAPPPPRLKLESYDFTSIESLERKWADAKTETTRMLSSAIYKYYFSHGEWQEFEQVFPAKVLESWEEFRNKLTQTELGFINTVLVSQNPFSSEQQGERETHIPVLARTIPLAQVVRTMVLSEDMRSRESYSSQNSNGPEIDSEFADWLITRFNAKRPGTATSPIEPAAAQPKEQKPEELEKQDQNTSAGAQTEQTQPQEAEPTAEQKPKQAEPEHSSKTQPESKQDEESQPEPKQSKEAQPPEKKQLPVPKTDLTQPTSNRKSLGLWSSEQQRPKTAVCLNTNNADAPKPRRKNTISGRSSDNPPSSKSTRRPTLTSMFQGWRKGSSKSEVAQIKESLNLPAPATEQRPATAARPSSSRSRRHTHNFFSSSSNLNDPARASLDMSRPSSRRIAQDIQMKDLPPLPANAAELSRGLRMEDVGVKMSQSASVLRKGSAALTHFSSHTDLMSQRMAAFRDKPRTSSLATSESSSQMRDSGSSEFVPMTYDWRPSPAHGDCSWGFAISPLALQRPLARKKSAALVVSSHTPTVNRRNQSPPKPTVRAHASAPLNVSRSLPENQTMRSPPPSEPSDNKLTPPELPKAKMPQGQLGLGISQSQGSKSNAATGTAALSGVRAVLYELAYLSTQHKSVWSKSDHIFANMTKAGLEVNRIAEQDFFDFCVDELLKSSYEASQDLQAMGNKKMAKKLYESFNTKLAILLADSTL